MKPWGKNSGGQQGDKQGTRRWKNLPFASHVTEKFGDIPVFRKGFEEGTLHRKYKFSVCIHVNLFDRKRFKRVQIATKMNAATMDEGKSSRQKDREVERCQE